MRHLNDSTNRLLVIFKIFLLALQLTNFSSEKRPVNAPGQKLKLRKTVAFSLCEKVNRYMTLTILLKPTFDKNGICAHSQCLCVWMLKDVAKKSCI